MDAETLAEWESLPTPKRLHDDGPDDDPPNRYSVLCGGHNYGATLAEAIHKAAVKVAELKEEDGK